MQENNLKHWFVVMTKPNQELKAIKNLRNQNFDVFCPYFQKEISVRYNSLNVKEFLFPSYIFVKFNLNNCQWFKIKNTLGVKKLLSNGPMPSKIDKTFVENLIKMSDKNGLLSSDFFSFEPMQKVVITKGPFKKIFGEVISIIGNNRVKVLLDCISNYKTLVLDKDFILSN